MLDLYFWTTDNGRKARHMVEETGLEHTIKPVNLREREQFAPEFMKISPGHKIPAIIDHDGPGGATVTLCESGAILKYLAEKAAPELYTDDPIQRLTVEQWLFWGSSTFTTLAQQYGHYTHRAPEKVPAAQKHYDSVLRDMLDTMNTRLGESDYLAGGYSIADISCYSDVDLHGVGDIGLDDYANLARWHAAIAARPAVERAWGPF